jgi:hypothetical protein
MLILNPGEDFPASFPAWDVKRRKSDATSLVN